MKMKLFAGGAVAAAIAVSSAVAVPMADKSKPKITGEGCKPRIAVILKGTLTETGNPIEVKVGSANHWGKAYVGGSDKQITVSGDTKVRGQGKKKVDDLTSGDRVLVQARVCKADLASNATPGLTATKVVAHSAKGAKNQKDKKDEKDND